MSYKAYESHMDQTWHLVELKLLRENGDDRLGRWVENYFTRCGMSLRIDKQWLERDNWIFEETDQIKKNFHTICPRCAELSPAYQMELLARTAL